MFKCQYVHFAHIRLSFGCTDEKIDLGICLHTYTRFSIQNKTSNMKSWNVPGHVFRISTNPDMGKSWKLENPGFRPPVYLTTALP